MRKKIKKYYFKIFMILIFLDAMMVRPLISNDFSFSFLCKIEYWAVRVPLILLVPVLFYAAIYETKNVKTLSSNK